MNESNDLGRFNNTRHFVKSISDWSTYQSFINSISVSFVFFLIFIILVIFRSSYCLSLIFFCYTFTLFRHCFFLDCKTLFFVVPVRIAIVYCVPSYIFILHIPSFHPSPYEEDSWLIDVFYSPNLLQNNVVCRTHPENSGVGTILIVCLVLGRERKYPI